MTYSAMSTPPMRGFIVLGEESPESKPRNPIILTKRLPIVGVVIRSLPDSEPTIVPVTLFNPCLNNAECGGLWILNPEDYGILSFAVVWCYWPEDDDESQLQRVHDFIESDSLRVLSKHPPQDSR